MAGVFLGLRLVLSGFTNVAKRLDVIVYPGNIRRVTGHARSECATSIRFQLITARTWCVGDHPSVTSPHPDVFVLRSLLQSSIRSRIAASRVATLENYDRERVATANDLLTFHNLITQVHFSIWNVM